MADFSAIKQHVSIEEVSQMLDLQLRKTGAQFRGPCPACKSGGDRAIVITPEKQLFYCFAAGIGGDSITLCGHIKKCSPHESGRHIAAYFEIGNESTSASVHGAPVPTAPEKMERGNQPAPPSKKTEAGFDPAKFAAGLTFSEEVAALGLTEELARRYKIGVHRGKLYLPVCPEEVEPPAWMEWHEGQLKLPSKWLDPKVVPFKKRA